MFTIWAVDCFFREFRTTPTCKHFLLFPSPGTFESAWLFMCVATSFFLIFHVCRSHAFPGLQVFICHLMRKKYFYKFLFVLFVVCIYDMVIIFDKTKISKTISYTLFMFEKFLAVTLVFFLNFLPPIWNGQDARLKLWLYKTALAIYALECYLLAILGSTIAVYKVLTVSEADRTWLAMQRRSNVSTDADSRLRLVHGAHATNPPDVKSVVDLMLLMTNNGLRYFLADFFVSKLFDESLDHLGGGKKKIAESLAPQRDEVMLSSAREVQETPNDTPQNSL